MTTLEWTVDADERRPARWFLLDRDRVQQGPFPLQAMRDRVLAGELPPETVVWADGMPDWMPAGEVPALIPPPAHNPEDPGPRP